ncbi:MAG TPA: hypothetical protein VFZ06_02190, partial [Acidimicrobiia bacterium]|nr:hypothetical protein [Acidimicrobiia bacterium]
MALERLEIIIDIVRPPGLVDQSLVVRNRFAFRLIAKPPNTVLEQLEINTAPEIVVIRPHCLRDQSLVMRNRFDLRLVAFNVWVESSETVPEVEQLRTHLVEIFRVECED